MHPQQRMHRLRRLEREWLAPRVQVAVADAEDFLAPVAVAGHRGVAVDPPAGVCAAVIDRAYSATAATRPPAALSGLVYRRVPLAHHVLAHTTAFLASLGVDLSFVVDRIAVLRVQGVAEFVDATIWIEWMRAGRCRIGVTADVIGLGVLWFQRGRNQRAAGECNYSLTQPSNERTTAAALCQQCRSMRRRGFNSQLARLPSAISCSRR